MKHSRLLLLMLLGIIFLSAIPAGAASGAGPYYATPSWDQTFPGSTRFVVLTNFNNEAVLDRETGLVWEQAPHDGLHTWADAQMYCYNLYKGKRYGWRLSTIEESMTLFDPTSYPQLPLPTGHPFYVNESVFWSATTSPDDSTKALWINLHPLLQTHIYPGNKDDRLYIWCVRAPE
jgi:hypothetical protein